MHTKRQRSGTGGIHQCSDSANGRGMTPNEAMKRTPRRLSESPRASIHLDVSSLALIGSAAARDCTGPARL